MTDQEEVLLRQRLSDAFPAEPAPPALLRRLTETVASANPPTPSRSTAPSVSRRSWWIAATAAAVVAVGITAIGLTIGSRPADSPVAAGDVTAAATADANAPVTVALPTSEWTPGMVADLALIRGQLVIGADGCLHIGGSVVIWPKGVYGIEIAPGTIEVHGPTGLALIRTGDVLTAGGGSAAIDTPGCSSEGERAVYIEDEGFVSGTPLPSDYGAEPEPTGSSVSSPTAGG